MLFSELLIYVTCYFGLFTAVVFLITFLQSDSQKSNPKVTRFAKVSIIVPVWNEEERVIGTLDSLINIDWPKDKLEIIIVNDGSTDRTVSFLEPYKIYPFVKVLTKKNKGKAKAMNYGLRNANGEFVMNLDADSSIDPWCLKEMLGYFDPNPRVMAVIPSMLIKNPKKFVHKIQSIEFLSATFMRRVFALLGGVFLAPGPGTVFRKEFFEKYGYIDEDTIVEDIEVSLRIQKYNYIIEHAYGVCSYTLGAHTFKHLISQRLRWFRGFIDMIIRFRELFSLKYGNLGLFILPISVFSIFLNLSLFTYGMFKLGHNTLQKLIDLYLINFDISNWFKFSFDPYFINTSPIAIVITLMIVVGILIIWIAKREAGVKEKISISYIIFVLSYWFLYSICWIKAIYYKFAKKKIRWGGKIG